MLPKIALILSSFFVVNIATAGNFCLYKNENQLLWDKDFSDKVHDFLGDNKAILSGRSQSIYNLAMENFAGPPDDLENMPNNSVFASACRVHDCGDKAAVVINCPNSISAVGILHGGSGPEGAIYGDITVTIFYKENDDASRAAFQKWANNISRSQKIFVKLESVRIGSK